MQRPPEPTERELAILKVLWERGESTVHQVYVALRDDIPIVQNTVQAFLRTMEQKGLVTHRVEGRSFVYRALVRREQTTKGMLKGMLRTVFDNALDELVEKALSLRQPTSEELTRLRALLDDVETKRGKRAAAKAPDEPAATDDSERQP